MKALLTTEEMAQMYVDRKVSATVIAKLAGMTANGVRDRLKKAGYVIRDRKRAIATEEIVRMYVGERMSMDAIAKQTGTFPTTILYRLKKAGIPRRHENANANPVTTDELQRMYFGEGLSPLVIGQRVGMSWRHVLKRLREAGYTARRAGRGRWMDSRLSPTEHPTVHDLCWAAGIYEGEGSCIVRRKSDANHSAAISVAQKDRWLCDRLRALFGGTVGVSTAKTGETYHYWRLTGMRARGFAMTIYKFLSPRRQARIREALAA